MRDALRWHFAAPLEVPAEAIRADLADLALAIGAGALLPALGSGGVGLSWALVPGAALEPWIDGPPPARLQLTLDVRTIYDREPPEAVERQADLVLTASPTGSFDLNLITPLLEALIQALDDPADWETVSRGQIAAHRLPSGWLALPVLLTPTASYGVEGDAVQITAEEAPP